MDNEEDQSNEVQQTAEEQQNAKPKRRFTKELSPEEKQRRKDALVKATRVKKELNEYRKKAVIELQELKEKQAAEQAEKEEVEEEEEEEPVKPVKTKKKVVKEIIESDSDSSVEEVIVRRKKKKDPKVYDEDDYINMIKQNAQEKLKERLNEERLRLARLSLFG